MEGMGTPLEALDRLLAAAGSGDLDALCERHAIRVLTVFGSAARTEPTAGDLDIGIISEPGADFDIIGVVNDLIDLTRFSHVDMAHLNRGGPLIRERALVGSILLYENPPGAFARAQMAAVAERMETDHFRRLDLELLAG